MAVIENPPPENSLIISELREMDKTFGNLLFVLRFILSQKSLVLILRPPLRKGAVEGYNLNDYFRVALAVLYGTKVARLAAVKATPSIVQFSKVIAAAASIS